MTAPAAPLFDIKDAINDAVASALPAPQPDPAPEAVADAPAPAATDLEEEPSEESPADTEAAPEETADDEPASDEPPSDGDSASDELPEGYVAVPTVTDGLATDFTLYDENGEVEVPALIVEYKANGKVRKDRLDQVVKMAQWGVYNQDKLQSEVQQQVAQYEQVLAEREQQMERLLNDENFLEAVREAYLEENSPEKRAVRAEQETTNLRIQYQLEQIRNSGEQFYAAEVAPALDLIAKALPSVTSEELESKLHMALQAHVETAPNGAPYISPSRYDAVRQYIIDDLALWAQAAHDRRSLPAKAEKSRAAAELERAQIAAQKAKRMVGQATKPVGTPAKESKPRAAKPSTVDDAVSSALTEVLSSIR